jgi:uncharacterized protein YkwD
LRMPRTLLTLVAILLCALAAAAARPDPARAITAMEKRLVARINDARAARGLRRLRFGPRVQRGAHVWARHLILADAFYHGRLAAGTSENIAWGNCSWMSVGRMVRMWLNSPPHRANMLDGSHRYVGTGIAAGRWNGYSCVRMAVSRFR